MAVTLRDVALEDRREEDAHDWLVMVPDGHSYQRFISDLCGIDPSRHDGDVAVVVRGVLAWLQSRPECVKQPTPAHVLELLPEFKHQVELLEREWLGRAEWRGKVEAARELASRL